MPFRDRVKRAFGRNSTADGAELSKNNSRKSSSIYQPGEQMPKPKYRQPVDKKHKEHLEAFSFADNVRRRSIQSNYSPMGSRLPSRNSSVDHGWMGYGRRHPPPGVLTDASPDNYVHISAFRQDSSDTKSTPQHLENISVSDTASESTRPSESVDGTAPHHRPFSLEDLNQALARSTSSGPARIVT